MSLILAFAAFLGLGLGEHTRYHKFYKTQFRTAQEQAWAECRDGSTACEMAYEIERADRMAWIKARNKNVKEKW